LPAYFLGSVVDIGEGDTGNEGVCLASSEGVAARLGNLKGLATFPRGECGRLVECRASLTGERDRAEDGRLGDVRPEYLGGDRGESTVTIGGERGGDRGPIDVGRVVGVAGTEARPSSTGVMVDENWPWCAGEVWTAPVLGKSRDMRPSPLVCPSSVSSHGLPVFKTPCDVLAGGCGSAGLSVGFSAGGLDFIMLSKWLRREDTGFC
jgi:hypothetical protein